MTAALAKAANKPEVKQYLEVLDEAKMRNGTEVLICNAVDVAEMRNGMVERELHDCSFIRRKHIYDELRVRYGEQYATDAHQQRHRRLLLPLPPTWRKGCFYARTTLALPCCHLARMHIVRARQHCRAGLLAHCGQGHLGLEVRRDPDAA